MMFRFLFPIGFCLLPLALFAQKTEVQYLSGLDKDHTVKWDFYCTGGRNSGKWTKIAVPSCWELQGFGQYDYGGVKNAEKGHEKGMYRYSFKVDKSWQGKQVNIVFDGSMTDTRVVVNGKPAGKIHQGAFYRFKYDISALLKYGAQNKLEVEVSKMSANTSVNEAERQSDFWVFGGIFRPVYLEALPKANIAHFALDAKADGYFSAKIQTQNAGAGFTTEAVIADFTGKNIVQKTTVKTAAGDSTTLQTNIENPKLWSPEFPNLYQLTLNLKNPAGQTVHSIQKKFGFRTAELRRKDGFYLNGAKVMFKGVDRHSFWPSSGRTMSKKLSIDDVEMMKDMNMNAVRMSHYPPDEHFLDVCDSLGLMVLDELTGWQHKYDDSTAHRLVKELVERDVNHTSVVIWDNGNEGGFNYNADADYAKYDPQKRLVIHPWERFNGTDTKHYPVYDYVQNSALYSDDVFFPTEFIHGLYDGGHGAALDDYWNLMLRHPHSAGGFLWVFADEAVERKDKKDSLDAAGNQAPDGIVGPYHEKEGSYFTIKEIWSPVYVAQQYLPASFTGEIPVENRFMFTNLNQCSFSWKAVKYEGISSAKTAQKAVTGKAEITSLKPGETGKLQLKLPVNWRENDVLFLTAKNPKGKEVYTWSWPIHHAKEHAGISLVKPASGKIEAKEEGDILSVTSGNVTLSFNKTSGYLEKVTKGKAVLSLAGGPVLAGKNQQPESFTHRADGENYVVKAAYKGDDSRLNVEWIFTPGMPVKLQYTYSQKGEADFMGITFNYPEEKITGMKWLGRGPYHVWKNRLKGQQFGLWEKAYNNTVTGDSGWKYPEFKGNHAQVYQLTVQNKEFPFTVYSENDNQFFQMLKPGTPAAATPGVMIKYPEGNLGFLDQIQPIGTKFTPPGVMGPQSQKNFQLNYTPVSNTLWFDFR